MFYNVTLTEDEYSRLIDSLSEKSVKTISKRESMLSEQQMIDRLMKVINANRVSYGVDSSGVDCFIWTGDDEEMLMVALDCEGDVHDECFWDLEEDDQLAIYISVMKAEGLYNEMF